MCLITEPGMATLLGNEAFADDKGSRGVSPCIPQVAPKHTNVCRSETAEAQTHTPGRGQWPQLPGALRGHAALGPP